MAHMSYSRTLSLFCFACCTLILTITFSQLFSPRALADHDAEEIDRMIKQLGSDDFREREAAMESLQRIGRQALPALRIAQNSENLEVRHRAKMLLDQLDVGIQPLLNRGARIHYYSKQKPSPVSVDGVEMVGTAFSDDDLMHVREFTNIKRLSIPNASRITNAGLAHIRHLRSLESLTIGGAPINDLSALSGLKG